MGTKRAAESESPAPSKRTKMSMSPLSPTNETGQHEPAIASPSGEEVSAAENSTEKPSGEDRPADLSIGMPPSAAASPSVTETGENDQGCEAVAAAVGEEASASLEETPPKNIPEDSAGRKELSPDVSPETPVRTASSPSRSLPYDSPQYQGDVALIEDAQTPTSQVRTPSISSRGQPDDSPQYHGEPVVTPDAHTPTSPYRTVPDASTTYELDKPWPRDSGWVPPDEPLRPENPYKAGLILDISRHEAPPPFGTNYPDYHGLRTWTSAKKLSTMTLVDLCLANPPMEGVTKDESHKLEIVDEMRVRDDSGSQLLVCRLDDDPKELVAKVYDPLYYDFKNVTWSDMPRDTTYEADGDYCREVAGYLELEKLWGTDVPEFHGSWTFELPLDHPTGKATRNIRMILIERVIGETMLGMKPEPIPEAKRLDTVARIFEIGSRVSFEGVMHNDISQRNIIVCDKGDSDTEVDRVVLIDFNIAVVMRLDNFEEMNGFPRSDIVSEKPSNPVKSWWGGGAYGLFDGWFPSRWEGRLKPLQQWLYERWGKSEEFSPILEPLEWDEENVPRMWLPA